MKKRLLILSLLLTVITSAVAGDISGVVVDSSDGSPLINASIRLLANRDSSYINGGITDASGAFRLRNIPAGRYIVEAAYLGYKSNFKNIRLASASSRVKTDTLRLSSNTIVLKEAQVVGVKTEVKVMQDTVEYNADSYKTQPNAVVEDLLKRLPGVEVGSDGTIKAQGKEITKILVDGEEFFSDDAKVASKNIPVDMVDKLQVIDRKSDLARLTGVDDGEEETVINLTVKKGMKQGWFGNINAGYGISTEPGSDNRYMGNFMVNRFIDKNQFSIIGNLNNINDPGFTNFGKGRFQRFGGMNGVNSTQSLGINFNLGKTSKLRIGGDVMYSHSDQKSDSKYNKQYLFTDSTSYEDATKRSRDKTHNISGNFRIKWEKDSFNTFDFRPNFKVSINDSKSNEETFLYAGDPTRTKVNHGVTDVTSDGTSYDLSGQLIYNRNFKRKRGRSISSQITYKYSNTIEDEFSYALNEYFLVDDQDEERIQYTDNRQWSSRVGARVTWKEPIGNIKKGHFLTFAYRMNYFFNNADKLVYDIMDKTEASEELEKYGIAANPFLVDALAEALGVYDTENLVLSPNYDLSNRFRNDRFEQDIRVGYQKNNSKYNINAGVSIVPTMMQSEDLFNADRNIPTRWTWNYAPFMRFRYKFSKQSSLALNYRGNSSSPTMTQLQPVADKSDPMKIVVGNPNLVPAFNHRLMLRYNNFNQESQRSIMLMGSLGVVQNSIVSKTTFDQTTGAQTTTYDNVNGNWSANVMNMFTTPFKNKVWHFSNHMFARYSRTVGYNNGDINRSSSTMLNETPSIAFRNDMFDIELRPYYNIQFVRNSLQKSSNQTVHSYGTTFNANYYAPFGLTISSDLTYGSTSGYSEGYDNEQWLWNASISYQLLKDKNLTIGVKAYDLLKQKLNISRTITANYITDNEYNTITRYVMLTASYKFSVFGKGSSVKDFDYGGRGPMGPPPGSNSRSGAPRRPMGPPPGMM